MAGLTTSAHGRDRLAGLALEGRPLVDVLVIDAHAHVVCGRTPTSYFPQPTTASMVASMDDFGVDVACISGIGSESHNALVAEAITQYPTRFVGFAQYNPRYADSAEGLELLLGQGGFKGIGEVHPTTYHNDYPITGDGYRPMWELAKQFNVPVLVHSGPDSERATCSPALIGEAAARYPEVTVILGHCGAYGVNFWPELTEAVDVARERANVLLDLCGTGRHWGIVEHVVSQVGAERVLFGSDAAFHGWAAEFAHVVLADLPERSKELILGANMARVLRLDEDR